MLQCAAVCCSVYSQRFLMTCENHCSGLHCGAVWCSILQCVAVCIVNVFDDFQELLQCVAFVVQRAAVCCSVV